MKSDQAYMMAQRLAVALCDDVDAINALAKLFEATAGVRRKEKRKRERAKLTTRKRKAA